VSGARVFGLVGRWRAPLLAALLVIFPTSLTNAGSTVTDFGLDMTDDVPEQEGALTPPDSATPSSLRLDVLSTADVERYRKIFTFQRTANWKDADKVMEELNNRVLVGHILAQRYLHPNKYQARYAELAAWIRAYGDHPDADEIHKLAAKRKPRGAGPPSVAPKEATLRYFEEDTVPTVSYQTARRRDKRMRREVSSILGQLRRHADKGRLTRADELLHQKRTQTLLDDTERNIAKFHVGSGYFYWGSPETAYKHLSEASKSSANLPFAHWLAGLSAFRIEKYDAAAEHFEAAASSGHFDSWDRAASAFWAGRANLLAGRPENVGRWLTLATEYPHTF
jgi:tetratricopeptide (TPR) repeat protein